MTYPLAVFVEVLGERSETFLRRHVMDLLPDRTVSLGRLVTPVGARDWEPPPPVVNPDEFINLRQVVARLHDYGVRVLLAEYLDQSLPWIEAVDASGIRLFVHAHGYDVSERLRDAACREAYLKYRSADGVITMSEHSRTTLVRLGLPAERVHSVPYGVDVPEMFTQRGRVSSSTIRALAVGRMVPKKAPMLLLEAFRQAALGYPGPMHLDYVGAGPLLEAAHHYVHATELGSCVTLHGPLPNDRVRAMMATADLFVQHSVVDTQTGDEEGLPVAILEGMSAGLPVVATRHAGIPEAVVEGVTGFLVDEGDTAAMAERIVALAQDPEVRSSMGFAGWARARDRFSWTRERTELLSVLGLRAFL